MAMLVLLSLQAAAPPPVMMVYKAPAAEQETLRAISYSCSVTDHGGASFRFKLDRTGGRAFVAKGRHVVSPVVLKVSEDPSARFAGYAFTGVGESIQARSDAADPVLGDWLDFQFRPAAAPLPDEGTARLALVIHSLRAPDFGMRPLAPALGFCDAVIFRQAPLSREEAAPFLRD